MTPKRISPSSPQGPPFSAVPFAGCQTAVNLALARAGLPRLGLVDLALPVGRWSNVLTGSGPWSGTVAVADLIGALPVAALERVS